MASLGVTNLASNVLPSYIATDPHFWTMVVKIEREEWTIDLEEYDDELRPGQKVKPTNPI